MQLIQKLKKDLSGQQGKKRFDILNDLAWEYRMAYPDSTIFYAHQAYTLGQELQLEKGLAEPLNFIGIASNYKGKRIDAYEYYDKALKIALNEHDSTQIAHANNNIGRLFFEQGLLSRSYEHFIRALAIFEAISDSSGIAYTYQSLANLYRTQGDFTKSENNYLKAYKIRLHLGNTRDIMSALLQTGRMYQDHNMHKKALIYLQKADSAGNVIHDEINLAEIKTFIADSYLREGRLSEAEATCQAGLDVILSRKNVRMLPQAYLTMGQIKLEKNERPLARQFFQRALDISNEITDLSSRMESYYWLWKLSEKENDSMEVLKNHNQYLLLKDSVKDLDLARQVERLQFEIEIQRKEQENELLKANHSRNGAIIQQQRLQNIILIVAVVFVSILGFVQWRNSKRRREANEKLAQQNQFIQKQRQEIVEQNKILSSRNQELSDLNEEKDTLMSIVAHDLKSPLNRIKGVAGLMELEGGLADHQKKYLKMIKDGTQAGLDLIKDLLDVNMLEDNVTPSYTSFDLSQFLLDKISDFRPMAESKRIHLDITAVQGETVFLDLDYLNRITDNLISNAIKFSESETTVKVSAGKTEHYVWISVKDEGPGFTDKDKHQLFQKFKKLSARPTAGETSNGLGLAIVKTLVDRLDGEITLTSQEKKGSEFTVKFPVQKRF